MRSASSVAANVQVHSSAAVHSSAQITGNVQISAMASVAPGVCIWAEVESPVSIGANSSLQEGVVLRSLAAAGHVLGDDRNEYGLWIGADVTLTPKVVVQGPAYIGSDCFVGFRSTLFNARLGAGSIVMMHALVQDVEIPPNRLVPSGAVVTNQAQADQLPDVTPRDRALAQELLGGRQFSFAGMAQSSERPLNQVLDKRDGLSTMQSQQLTSEIVQQVRNFLAQGYRIGAEHADPRRFRSNVWQTCSPIQSTRESEVFRVLETCLGEHSGEYVRVFGIDPVAKRRVGTVTIQRPDGKPLHIQPAAVPSVSHTSSPNGRAVTPIGRLSGEIVQQVRNFLAQGFRIGTEHADSRRYRSNVWQTCSPIQSTRESEVLSALEACLAEHSGEYVRMFGIDPIAKRRVGQATVQHPGDKPTDAVSSGSYASASTSVSGPMTSGSASQGLSGEALQNIRQFINQGYRIGMEHADQRRYRSNVWQSCPSVQSTREAEVIAALSACLAEHPGEYVRIFGIDPSAKRRVASVTIQRPGDQPASSGSPPLSAPAAVVGNGLHSSSGNGVTPSVSADLTQQVSQLINQGYRIGIEHADVRRYRSGAWQNGGSLEGRHTGDIMAQLESHLRQHSGEYVRLIGIDPQAKRRVLETTIQRP